MALDDFVGLAEPHTVELDGLDGFELAMLERAGALIVALRGRSAVPPASKRDALRLRNQIWTLLHDRIRVVRFAASYVLRDHPMIARAATSEYRHRQHRAAQHNAASNATVEEESQTGTPVQSA